MKSAKTLLYFPRLRSWLFRPAGDFDGHIGTVRETRNAELYLQLALILLFLGTLLKSTPRLILVFLAFVFVMLACYAYLYRHVVIRSLKVSRKKEFKTSIEHFRNLSYFLTTAGGASLLFKHDDIVFALSIFGNVLLGMAYLNFFRMLLKEEVSENGVNYLWVNSAQADFMSSLVRWQIRLIVLALAWITVKVIVGG